jgi:cytochrome c553
MKHLNKLLIVLAVSLSPSAQAGGDAAAGKVIATEKCQACHGIEGNNDNAQFPRLAGQYANYLARALSDYQSGARANPIMAGQAASLSGQDIKNVSAWFASQSGLETPVQPRTVSK